MRHRLIQFGFVQARQFPKFLLMHSVQYRPEFGWGIRRACLRHRVRTEQALEVGREECVIVRPLAPDAPQRQAVLGEGDVAHLPGDMADAARRQPKPLVGGRLVEQSKGVVPGDDDLLDGK